MADVTPQLSEREMAELCAFADGSLPVGRREAIEARLAASPELLRVVERQRSSLLATQALAAEPVPPSVAASVEALRTGRARRRRRPLALTLSAAGVLAAIAVTFLVLSLSGGPAAPSVADAARLAVRPPSGPAPATVSGTKRFRRGPGAAVP